MSRRPRRNRAPAFKATVALAAIKGDQPRPSQLGAAYRSGASVPDGQSALNLAAARLRHNYLERGQQPGPRLGSSSEVSPLNSEESGQFIPTAGSSRPTADATML